MSLEIIKKYGIKAKKSLGQNFLFNEEILNAILKQVDIEGKNIIEVGPGYGALSEKIIQKKPKKLSLLELDRDMIDIINTRIEKGDLSIGNIDFNIINIDVLKYEPDFKDYYLIANIPYYITSPILRHFIYKVEIKPEKMLILMQKDVGDKILGGNKNKSSVISLFVSKKFFAKEVLFVGRENFHPKPKVESSVILFEKHNLYDNINDEFFLKIIKQGFLSPRKKLLKNLVKSGYNKENIAKIFNKLLIDTNTRGEDLNIAKWCDLIGEINK